MSEHFKAIVVREDGTMTIQELDFEGVQKTVGGYVEADYGPGDVVALMNEDGRRLQLPYNRRSALFVGYDVCGPIVFVGYADGDFTDAPDALWGILEAFNWVPIPSVPPEAVTDGSADVNVLSDHEIRLAEAAMVLREHGYQVTAPRPDAKPRVRSGAPDTSRAVEPKLNSGLGRVLDALRQDGPMTDDELEVDLGLTHQSVSAARRNGVIRGLIYDTGLKRKTRSGNDAIVWKAVR